MKVVRSICVDCGKEIVRFGFGGGQRKRRCEPCRLNKKRSDGRTYYAVHAAREILRSVAWGRQNPERMRGASARWKKKNPERTREKSRLYYQNNRTTELQRHRQYARLHPEIYAIAASNRRALLAGIPGDYSLEQWLEVVSKQGGLCFYCGERLPLTADHRIPITRLELSPTNYIDNIVGACKSCNSSKRVKTDAEFMDLRMAQ